MRKYLALCSAALLAFTSIPLDDVYATEIMQNATNIQSDEESWL